MGVNMKPNAYINKIAMALLLAVLLLIALVGGRLGLFTDLDEEPHIREDADKSWWGCRSLEASQDGGQPIQSRCRMRCPNRMGIS